jgi:hypothetical protein
MGSDQGYVGAHTSGGPILKACGNRPARMRRHDRETHVLRIGKAKTFIRKAGAALRDLVYPRNYKSWVARYNTPTGVERKRIVDEIASLPRNPIISMIIPVCDDDWPGLLATVRSLRTQLYPYWELCLAADCLISKQHCAELRQFVHQDHQDPRGVSRGYRDVVDQGD